MSLTSKLITIVPLKKDNIYNQTIDIFEQASKYFPIAIRMWIKLYDMDNNYLEFSNARNYVFKKHGYLKGSRTFVSTCVGSKTELKLKILIIPGINKTQISFIDLPAFLPHTNLYNVSFERGNKIQFKNCTHYYISGTASIDEHGDVLYKGNIINQTKRIFLIIKKMLNKQLINIDNIIYMKWYVRESGQIIKVNEIVKSSKYYNSKIDLYFEQAEICRKEWLVEAECFAMTNIGNPNYEEFNYAIL